MARIDADRLARPGATLSPLEMEAFVGAARRLTGRGDLAFDVGLGIKVNSHELLGYAMISCKNFDQVMRLVSRHYYLLTTMFTLRYRRQARIAEAIYTPTTPLPLEMLRFYLEVIAVTHQNQLKLMVGEKASGYDIHVSIPKPAHIARYNSLAPARFHFDEAAVPGVRAIMDSELVDAPMSMPSARVVQQIEERLDAQRVRLPANGQWAPFLTMMLRESRGQQLTLDEIAQRLQVSPRTIGRALSREEVDFRELSQRVMFEHACELLDIGGATVSQVAGELGFHDSSSFSRSFRRVAGISPSEFVAAPEAARRSMRAASLDVRSIVAPGPDQEE
jgi:AraC-like DNA-binding protein